MVTLELEREVGFAIMNALIPQKKGRSFQWFTENPDGQADTHIF